MVLFYFIVSKNEHVYAYTIYIESSASLYTFGEMDEMDTPTTEKREAERDFCERETARETQEKTEGSEPPVVLSVLVF